jgi:sugar phosphate isomerase/epimerase
MKTLQRRRFLQSVLTASAVTGLNGMSLANTLTPDRLSFSDKSRFKISLNAYSFNKPLIAKTTSLEELIGFCSKEGFDAIDTTGYYFPGYPEVPSDEYIYRLKNKAHRSGIEISGTGIRNEFAEPDKAKRKEEVLFVKRWIEVAAKLGAPVIRIFTGKTLPANHSWEEVEEWIVEDIISCVDHAKKYGVIVAVQNHNDFVKTADQAIDIIKKVNSEWFGLVLDTGSFVTEEPYHEIEKTARYAVNWQIKEKLNYQGQSIDMNLKKLFRIIKASDYRGYLPIETLSPGDPFQIVPPFLKLVRSTLDTVMNQ